jgi:pimeloyl-ACP methyl ester carboxylesterase
VAVEYAITADGVRIAFSARGAGRTLVYMPPIPFRHFELEWHLPEDRRWLERLGRGRRLVRYDPRGLGLSERQVKDFTLDALTLDLAAVVDATAADEVALFACVNSAPIAVAYALAHPGRVSRLIVWCPVARMADSIAPQVVTLLELAEKDWELFTEAAAHVMVGWSKGEAAHRYAEYLRACVTPDVARAFIDTLRAADVTELLQDVRSPTLVLHRRGIGSVPVTVAAEIADRTPGARLMILEGESMRPGVGDLEGAARAVDAFVGDVGAEATRAREAETVAPYAFCREGEYWTLTFAGHVSRLRDAKGLHHIARLLRDPGVAVPAAELVAADRRVGDPRLASSLGDAGHLLDDKAKAAYKRRLAELRVELEDAEDTNDFERAAKARAELGFISEEVSAAVGLGGRDRKASSAAERARLTVTKRIKDAIARIHTSDPALARHLGATIKTGHLCAYRPDPARPFVWAL